MTTRTFGRSTSAGDRFTINTDQEGLEVLFGPLEALVMQIVWARRYPVSTTDVYLQIGRLGVESPPAKTTVQTTLNRLVEKGVLVRETTPRAAVLFRAALDQDTYLQQAAREALLALDRLLGRAAMETARAHYRD